MKKSVIYELRRKCQIAAYRLTNAEFMSKVYYRIVLHKKLNLKNPKTLNEKLQWLKLNYWPKSESAIQCADKYRVREYLEDKGFGEYLNELYYVWDSAEDINWDELPEQFALKCNHGCGYNIICPDKSKLDIKDAKNKLNKWMNEKFGEFNAEPHYDKIKPQIICEKYLGGDMVDYKFFCFNGEPEFMFISTRSIKGDNLKVRYFDKQGNKAEYSRVGIELYEDAKIPENFDFMMEMSRSLSKDFPFVRVDLFEVDGKIYFSELTFTPGGALLLFTPSDCDEKLGDFLDISSLKK